MLIFQINTFFKGVVNNYFDLFSKYHYFFWSLCMQNSIFVKNYS
jgi:hypothetical protein